VVPSSASIGWNGSSVPKDPAPGPWHRFPRPIVAGSTVGGGPEGIRGAVRVAEEPPEYSVPPAPAPPTPTDTEVPGATPAAESSRTARELFAPFRNAERRVQLRICLAAAHLLACDAPRWLGHSQNDYIRARLGLPPATFRTWVRQGRYLAYHRRLIPRVREGQVTLSEIDAWARGVARLEKADSEHPTRGPDRGPSGGEESPYRRVRFRVPLPAAAYLEETFRLARALLGYEAPDDECLEVIVAEACSELTPTVGVEDAHRRFPQETRPVRRRTAASSPALPPSPVPPMGPVAQRRRAHRLHRIVLRLLQRRRTLRVRQEDQLLHFLHEGIPQRCGFSSFERFCSELLDLPPSTVWDRVARARQRQRNHPLAQARAQGRLTTIQCDLLQRLQKRAHLAPSDLPAWVDYAQRHTVRRLREACDWAQAQSAIDHRRWSLDHCPPPTGEQLRTFNRPLEEILRHSEPEDLFLWDRAPRVSLSWVIAPEIHDLLVQAMATLQDHQRRRQLREGLLPRRDPPWLLLCRLFHRTRRTWALHHDTAPRRRRQIFTRTGWRCAAPECTRRRNLHAHHIRPRARGGGDELENLVPLYAFHHLQGVHQGVVQVQGRLDPHGQGLRWRMGIDEHGRAEISYRDECVETGRPENPLPGGEPQA